MQKLLISAAVLLLAGFCAEAAAQQPTSPKTVTSRTAPVSGGYTVTGTLKGLENTTIYLGIARGGKTEFPAEASDSALVSPEGAFTFRGQVAEPVIACLMPARALDKTNFETIQKTRPVASFLLDNGQTTIEGTVPATSAADLPKVTSTSPLTLKWEAIVRDMLALAETRRTDKAPGEILDSLAYANIALNRDNMTGALLLASIAGWTPLDKLEAGIASIDPSVSSAYLDRARFMLMKRSGRYIDIELADSTGQSVKLSDVLARNNKYVLLDFWASWCGPCRRESPHLVAAYQKYHGLGFEIYGVSLDKPEAADAWKKAMCDDGFTWPNVSALQTHRWVAENETARLYGVESIPSNFLIRNDGVIVATNLRGADLEAKLAELLGQ